MNQVSTIPERNFVFETIFHEQLAYKLDVIKIRLDLKQAYCTYIMSPRKPPSPSLG